MTQHTELPSDLLPTAVRDFLAAHIAGDADTASAFLVEDVVLVDQGETVRGREKAHAFLRDAGSEFEYTTEQTGARRVDDAHWVVTVRLEGTFPGGVAELDYRFALRDDLVAELVIANHTA
ncbi:nuclear transport factor 2 family protein [Pseudonocardia sp. N23]|uniref:nuclear transport factor 2 family protein n=1 Tax=Pseudonocardia sp. N23 TaxID=1987376 RepID=UPI000BFD1B2F|nr:nuclear transport factor 2 family protein [Pseudonocardia sp. N23]